MCPDVPPGAPLKRAHQYTKIQEEPPTWPLSKLLYQSLYTLFKGRTFTRQTGSSLAEQVLREGAEANCMDFIFDLKVGFHLV